MFEHVLRQIIVYNEFILLVRLQNWNILINIFNLVCCRVDYFFHIQTYEKRILIILITRMITSFKFFYILKVPNSRVPDTSYHRHFIFQVTSYQREKLSLHTSHFIPSHFIQSDTSYQSLHTKPFHTEVTSYQPLHTNHFIPKSLHTSHFISKSLHTNHFIPVTSYQAT